MINIVLCVRRRIGLTSQLTTPIVIAILPFSILPPVYAPDHYSVPEVLRSGKMAESAPRGRIYLNLN